MPTAIRSLVCAMASLLFAPSAAPAEVATALILEGDPLGGQTVTAINNTSVNHEGGYAATLSSTGPGGTLSHVWGSHGGGSGSLLRTEATIGIYEQTSFESFFEIGDGAHIAYSATCSDTSGASSLDAVWVDDSVAMIETAQFLPQPGLFWTFGSRPGITATGAVYFVGGVSNVSGGATQFRGLFFEPGSLPFDGRIVLFGGQSVPGLPAPLSNTSSVDFDYRFSKDGTHYVTPVVTQTGSSLNDDAVVIDSTVALGASGQPVIENSLLGAGDGGLPGERWDNFDYVGINEAGEWMLTGDTDAAIDVDEFIALNGVIAIREGDVIEGDTLSGALEGAYFNENGDVAYVWDVAGGSREVLGFRAAYDGVDRLLLFEGDSVDLDGDGNPDDATLVDFTGISTLTMSDADGSGFVNIYVTADLDVVPTLTVAPVVASRIGGSLDERGLEEPFGAPRGKRVVQEALLVVRVQSEPAIGVDGTSAAAPAALLEAMPNPLAADGTTLRYTLLERGPTRIALYDVNGRLVRTLLEGTIASGEHTLHWNGRNASGRRVGAGVYFARLETAGGVRSQRLTIVR